MWAEQAARKFRALLQSLNKLTTQKGTRGHARRNAVEGEAAQIGVELEEHESKGRPKHKHTDDNVDRAS
jgi:hypothetical protein